jgi:hypothetical protein
MLEDIRDHDPRPTEEERDWVASNAFGLAARVILATGVALMVGVSASALVDRYGSATIASSAASTPAATAASPR